DDQRGKYSAYSSAIELRVRERLGLNVLKNDRGDQESRDHEEDIDTDEAAHDRVRECVKADDRENGDSAQPVDVRPIFGMAERAREMGVPRFLCGEPVDWCRRHRLLPEGVGAWIRDMGKVIAPRRW